jgi:outer membrane protein assembly factor BamB
VFRLHTTLLRVSLALGVLSCALVANAEDWPQFRGPRSNSAVEGPQPPTNWSDADQQNIAWKVALPGRGPASPIVVGSKVIVTASSGVNQDRLHVVCFSADDGQQLWHRQFWATGRTLSHPSSANAAPTPASDGELVFAFYSSNDLVCLDLDGNLKWYRGLAHDYPAAGNDVGMSSSPIVAGDIVIAQVECQGDSFATGIDKHTGEPRWRIPRPREASWCSPVVMRGPDGSDCVLLQSPKRISAHRVDTGEQVWSYDVACDAISSPTVHHDQVIVASKGLTALKPQSGGEPQVLWNAQNLQPGAASPVIAGDRLYMINRAGVLNCADLTSDKPAWRVRLEGEFWGTPVVNGNRLYAISKAGKGQVVEFSADGKRGEIVGGGQLEGEVMSSPAWHQGALYVRSDGHLWKIAAPQ